MTGYRAHMTDSNIHSISDGTTDGTDPTTGGDTLGGTAGNTTAVSYTH